jgi:hypothetical protein
LASAYSSIGDCAERLPQPLLLVGEAAITATVEELRTDWGIVVSRDGERKELKRSDYVLWGAYSDEGRSSQVLLTDGTVLVGEIVRIEDLSVTIASRLWGELRLDRQMVRAWCLLPQSDPLARDREQRLLQSPEPIDRVLLLNRDALAGKLLPTTERDGGGLFGLVSIGIALSDAAPATSVLIDEVRAITFQASPTRESHAECLLGFRDGSLVPASMLTVANSEVTQITTVAGASLQLRTDELLKNLTFIQPQNETVTYLSDLPAVGYKFLPFLELDWPLGIATNTLGGRLRSGGKIIFTGLGMHSVSRVAYTLDRQYRRLEAELALDEHAKRQGSVIYRVLVERDNELGQSAWSLAFTSPIIRGGDPPLSMSLDVNGATRLALVVEMADRVDTRDYANWLNARLLR